MKGDIKIRKEKDDKFLIYVPKNRSLLFTNEVGYKIIQYFKEGKNMEEIVLLLEKEYEIDKKTLENDVANFLNKCKNYGVLK